MNYNRFIRSNNFLDRLLRWKDLEWLVNPIFVQVYTTEIFAVKGLPVEVDVYPSGYIFLWRVNCE